VTSSVLMSDVMVISKSPFEWAGTQKDLPAGRSGRAERAVLA
jgi:hypothetical protein